MINILFMSEVVVFVRCKQCVERVESGGVKFVKLHLVEKIPLVDIVDDIVVDERLVCHCCG